jgi:hypothetical protein
MRGHHRIHTARRREGAGGRALNLTLTAPSRSHRRPDGPPSPVAASRESWRTPAEAPVNRCLATDQRSAGLPAARLHLQILAVLPITPGERSMGAKASEPLSGLASGASRFPLRVRGVQTFAGLLGRKGRSGQLLPLSLYIPAASAGATRLSPGCCLVNGIGVAPGGGSIKLSKNVCPESPVPSIRLASRASSVGAQIKPRQTSSTNLGIAWDGTVDSSRETFGRVADLQCFQTARSESWRVPALRRSHHPATAASATWHRAARASNYSGMAANS